MPTRMPRWSTNHRTIVASKIVPKVMAYASAATHSRTRDDYRAAADAIQSDGLSGLTREVQIRE
jgi:hypothetical protein